MTILKQSKAIDLAVSTLKCLLKSYLVKHIHGRSENWKTFSHPDLTPNLPQSIFTFPGPHKPLVFWTHTKDKNEIGKLDNVVFEQVIFLKFFLS
jgi:hypothetical protein